MSEVSTPVGAPQGPISTEQSQQAENATEQQATEVSAEPQKQEQDLFAPKFAALSRKEKQVKQMEAQIKAREAELQKKLQEIEGKGKETEGKLESFEKAFKENPLKAIKDRGITLEQLMEMQLNDENPTVDMKLERLQKELESKALSKVEELEKKLREKEEAEQKQRYEAAVTEYKQELNSFIENNKETYELIAANNGIDLMFEVAEEYYQTKGEVLDTKQLADIIEQHFEEQAKKIFELKKFKQTSQKPEATKTQTAPTLSNTQAADVPTTGRKILSNEESLREAAKLLRWEE